MTPDPYRRLAEIHDALTDPFNIGLRQLGLKMAIPRRGLRVLEIGCGTGTNLQSYHRSDRDGFGINLSPAMPAVAKRKLGLKAGRYPGDASRPPTPDGVFVCDFNLAGAWPTLS